MTQQMPRAERMLEKSAPWKPYQTYVLMVLLLVSLFNYIDRLITSLLQESIKADLSLTDWQLGLINGPAFALCYSIAAFPLARFAERVHRPHLLGFAVAVWSSATALCASVGNFVQLALCRAGVGMGEGAANPVSQAIVGETFSVRQRGTAMSVLSAGSPAAAMIAPIVVATVAHVWGWRAAFLVVGAAGVLVALLVYFTVREPRETATAEALEKAKPKTFWVDVKWLAQSKSFPLLFIGGAFYGIGVQGVGIFATSYLMRELHMSLAAAAGVMSLRGALGLVGTFTGGVVSDRLADTRGRIYLLVPTVGGVLACIFYFWAFRLSVMTWSVSLLLLGYMAADLKNGPLMAAIQNIVPSRMRATGVAFYFFAATVLGTTLGAMLVGGLSDWAASAAFGDQFGAFVSTCPGGRALAGSGAELAAACQNASGAGLRTALGVVPLSFLVATVMFYLCSRKVEINRD